MEYIGLDVHLYTSTLHVLDRCGGDLKTVTLKGGWQKVVGWLRQRRRVFSICYEASAGYGPFRVVLTLFEKSETKNRDLFRSMKKKKLQNTTGRL